MESVAACAENRLAPVSAPVWQSLCYLQKRLRLRELPGRPHHGHSVFALDVASGALTRRRAVRPPLSPPPPRAPRRTGRGAPAPLGRSPGDAPIFHDDFESGELDASSPDEAQLRALIDGPPPDSSAVVTALETIGRSFGLPVHTQADSYLFAADCGTEHFDLVGDFNAWVPETIVRSGALCYLERTIAEPVESKYKFYLDPPLWFADARARRFQYDQFGEISLVRSSLAHLERWFGFGPEQGLSVRQLHVWVPADRAFDRILYLHDGQNLFDPAAPWGGWQLQDALPVGVLAVGIHNTAQRCDEYTPTWDAAFACGGDAPLYAALVHQTIRPFVEKRYGAGSHRGLLGSSLGGLVSLYIALQFPGEYDFAGSLSGSFWWDSDWIVSAYAGAGHGTTRVYLDSGGGGSCPAATPTTTA